MTENSSTIVSPEQLLRQPDAIVLPPVNPAEMPDVLNVQQPIGEQTADRAAVAQTGDALDRELGRLVGLGASRLMEGMTSKDPNRRAQARRTFDKFTAALTGSAVQFGESPSAQAVKEAETSPDGAFNHLHLSGDEAKASLLRVVDGLDSPNADALKQHYAVQAAEATTGQSTESADVTNQEPAAEDMPATQEQAEDDGSKMKLPEAEALVAEQALVASLAAAEVARKEGRLITPATIWEATYSKIEAAVLMEGDTRIGATPTERKAVVARVFATLPGMMRTAFVADQLALQQAQQEQAKAAAAKIDESSEAAPAA